MVCSLLLLASCSNGGVAETEMLIARGKAVDGRPLYQAQCALCHGVQLQGQPNWRKRLPSGVLPAPPHDASGHTWHHDDALLFEYTKYGGADAIEKMGLSDVKSGMPAFDKQLSDQQILDVLAYIRSTWSLEIQKIQMGHNKKQ